MMQPFEDPVPAVSFGVGVYTMFGGIYPASQPWQSTDKND